MRRKIRKSLRLSEHAFEVFLMGFFVLMCLLSLIAVSAHEKIQTRIEETQ
jgi:hypothetical protein